MDGPALQALLRRPSALPLQDERARLLREVRVQSPSEKAAYTVGLLKPEKETTNNLHTCLWRRFEAVIIGLPVTCVLAKSHSVCCSSLRGSSVRMALGLRQVGRGVLEGFGGQAVHLVHAAGRSAAHLVTLLTAAFPGFRDHCIYRCAVSPHAGTASGGLLRPSEDTA